MNIKEIKEMINLMNENNLNELEIEKEGMRVKLKRGQVEEFSTHTPVIIEKSQATNPQTTQKQEEQPKTNAKEIKSPMVGTFYRAPSPEVQPFAEVGQVVQPQDTVCIIEAMKLMNEIKAEIKGKIVQILVDNAQPIEFGQPLFLIEPI